MEQFPSSTSGGQTRRGFVRRFYPDRGFGFILPAGAWFTDTAKQIFVHFKNVQPPRYLLPGELVEFDLGDRPGHPGQQRAVNVRPILPLKDKKPTS